MAYQLDEHLRFPHPSLADEDGLLAVGGDLSSERLLLAYQHGIFPWYSEESPILWYAPNQRFVLKPSELKISKSMDQIMRAKKYKNTYNTAFKQVIENRASIKREHQDGTWITQQMQQAYVQLHKLGHAHSFETYDVDGQLIGGLY